MGHEKSILRQLGVFLLASVFVLITAIILIVHTWQRVQEFVEYNKTLDSSLVHGAAEAIKYQLDIKQRHTRLFVDEYSRLLEHLQRFPNDQDTFNDVQTRLSQRFGDFFTFTITDALGQPLLVDVESFVGEACRNDLKGFSKTLNGNKGDYVRNRIFIHPQAHNYHYDIMVPLAFGGQGNIFFVSFYPRTIADILRTHQLPGRQLILVKQSDPSLIEVTAAGSRDKISGNHRLENQQIARARAQENIIGTDWKVISLTDTQYQKRYVRNLWKEAIIIMLVVVLAMILLVFAIVKLPRPYDID